MGPRGLSSFLPAVAMGPGGGRPLSQALAEDLDTQDKEEVWGNRAPGWGRGENASSFGLCQ